MDGGRVTHKDASRQRDALVRVKSRRASSPSTPRKLDDSARYCERVGGRTGGLAASKCSSDAYTGLAASSRHPRKKLVYMEARVFL